MHPLHQKAKQIAERYKKCEQELLKVIMDIDQCKMFYGFGYNSLFQYIVKELKLSEAVAYNFINVARKSQKVPELAKAVLSGKISISKARKVVPVIEPHNQEKWIELAESKSQKQIERQVALASPKNAIVEKTNYIHPQSPIPEKISIKSSIVRMHLSMGISEKLMLKIRRAQDLECQRQKAHIGLEETLEAVVSLYLEKKDPLKKAQRQKAKGKLKEKNVVRPIKEKFMGETVVPQLKKETTGHNRERSSEEEYYVKEPKKQNLSQEQFLRGVGQKKQQVRRKPIAAELRHAIYLRDQGQCAFKDKNGNRCSSQRYLEFHHILPVSKGGKDTLDNLVTLCRGHHQFFHSNLHKDHIS